MGPNPDYDKGELELKYIWRDGQEPAFQFPMRFWAKDQMEAINALRQHDWETLKRLSIPPYTQPQPKTPAPT